jgi:FMN-dependent NADH-azoreductase
MEEFDNLKIEHAFMKAIFMNYQKRSKRSQLKQWDLYKKQVGELFRKHLSPIGKMKSCINYTWKPINE